MDEAEQNIQPGDKVLLVIEDDTKFGQILLDHAGADAEERQVRGRGVCAP